MRMRRLLTVWALLAALIGVIVALELAESPGEGHAAEEPAWLLPAPLEKIGAIEIGHAGRLHRFERGGDGQWHRSGKPDPKAARRIDEALAAFARTRTERRVPYDAKSAQYGVTAPGTVVVLYPLASGEPLARYAIGDVAPDTLSRYVHRAGSAEVVTIPGYQVDNLLLLLAR